MDTDLIQLKILKSDILRECFRKNIRVDEDFLEFYVELFLLFPENKWLLQENVDVSDRRAEFITTLRENLKNQNTPQFVTLKIQWYYKYNFEFKEKICEKHKKELAEKLEDLKKDILNTKNVNETYEIEIILRKVLFYIILTSGMGSPLNEEVFQESEAAFKSIVSEKELKELTTLPKRQKHNQIVFLTKLVTGIRIFNKDCGKGGEDIIDLPGLLYKSLELTRENLRQLLVDLMQKINAITTGLDKCYKIKFNESGKRLLGCCLPDTVCENDMEYVKSLLVTYRQYEIYLRQLMQIIEDDESINTLYAKLKNVLTKIHEICSIRVAVSCAIIFPLFEQLSEIWSELQNEVIYLSIITTIMENLTTLVETLEYPEETIKNILENFEIMTDAQRLQRYLDIELNLKNEHAFITSSENKNLDTLYIECIRCDPWKLVNSGGGLFPGIPTIGIAVTLDSFQYIFSEPEAAKGFFEDVPGIMFRMCSLFNKQIELIEIFNARKFLILPGDGKMPSKTLKDTNYSVGVQTEKIVLEKSKEHIWNCWELKKKALILANLSRCKTKSVTTDITHSKKSVNL